MDQAISEDVYYGELLRQITQLESLLALVIAKHGYDEVDDFMEAYPEHQDALNFLIKLQSELNASDWHKRYLKRKRREKIQLILTIGAICVFVVLLLVDVIGSNF